ncbi:MAG: GtrA family protein [Acidobacteria bacterium]|nr:GtrA family protein [Acidobacteriota bacterium]
MARFGTVGVLGTAVYLAFLWTLVELLRVPVLIATSIAFLLVCIENYLLHYSWTFASSNAHTVAFPRFVFMNVVGFWINWGIMFAGVEKKGALTYLLVQAVAIAAVLAWNLALSSYWVFRDSRSIQESSK